MPGDAVTSSQANARYPNLRARINAIAQQPDALETINHLLRITSSTSSPLSLTVNLSFRLNLNAYADSELRQLNERVIIPLREELRKVEPILVNEAFAYLRGREEESERAATAFLKAFRETMEAYGLKETPNLRALIVYPAIVPLLSVLRRERNSSHAEMIISGLERDEPDEYCRDLIKGLDSVAINNGISGN